MKKKVGIIKRVLCIGLIFLLSINSFAAIVSDNDGSAFITKAEFDALKSSFQSQIDTYNQSIDSKIDGAIASYLAGIQIAKEQKVSTLLDKNGNYGGTLLKWSSETTTVWDNQSAKKANLKYDISDFDWDEYTTGTKPWTGTDNYYTGYLRGVIEHAGETSAEATKYTTSKLIKTTDWSGASVDVFQRTKMQTDIFLNMTQWTPYRNAATTVTSPGYWNMGGPKSVINNNMANMKQDVAGLYVDTFSMGKSTRAYRNFAAWGYAFTGTVTIRSMEFDTGISYELLAPKSTTDDYYWDPTDKSSSVRNPVWADLPCTTRYTSPLNWTGTGWPKHTDIDAVVFTPNAAKTLYVPWMEHKIAHNEMILQSLLNVHNHNRKIKNGIIIYQIVTKNKLTFVFNSDMVGNVELYIGETPTDTWSTNVLTKNISAANVDTKFEIDGIDETYIGKYIWLRFLPTAAGNATLKVTDAYETTED